jgi:hypothetical protein
MIIKMINCFITMCKTMQLMIHKNICQIYQKCYKYRIVNQEIKVHKLMNYVRKLIKINY